MWELGVTEWHVMVHGMCMSPIAVKQKVYKHTLMYSHTHTYMYTHLDRSIEVLTACIVHVLIGKLRAYPLFFGLDTSLVATRILHYIYILCLPLPINDDY